MMRALEVVAGKSGCYEVADEGIIIALFYSVADANIYVMMLVEHGLADSGYLADGTLIKL